MATKLLFLVAALPLMVPVSSYSSEENKYEESSVSRNPRFFWKFILISPDECNTTTGTYGVCYSKKDCKGLNGQALGTCAKGLGVCCYITNTCDGSSSAKVSRFVNPSSPSTDASFATYSNMCMYTVKLRNNICQLRLDMDTFSIVQPDANGVCIDTFDVLRSTNPNIPTICGENAGQHMYIDVDPEGPNPKLVFAGLTATFARKWNIKITQIECNSAAEVPKRCLQHFTGVTGTVKSFNFDGGLHLANQNYEVCVDQLDNYCQIGWATPDSTATGSTFVMTGPAGTAPVAGAACADYVLIKSDAAATTKYCGGTFTAMTSSSLDFGLQVFTGNNEITTAATLTTPAVVEKNIGFKLLYTQSSSSC